MAGHTPGPWTTEPHGRTTALYSGRGPQPNGFAVHGLRLMNLDDGDHNFEANCVLIAAAPDLLAALERIRDAAFQGILTPDLCAEIVMTAIAKAEGRS